MFCCEVTGLSYLNVYENKFYNTAAIRNEICITSQELVSVQINITEKY